MELPNIKNVLRDNSKNIRYEVFAYRALTKEELVLAVRQFNSSSKKKPKKNSCVQITTLIGLRD